MNKLLLLIGLNLTEIKATYQTQLPQQSVIYQTPAQQPFVISQPQELSGFAWFSVYILTPFLCFFTFGSIFILLALYGDLTNQLKEKKILE